MDRSLWVRVYRNKVKEQGEIIIKGIALMPVLSPYERGIHYSSRSREDYSPVPC